MPQGDQWTTAHMAPWKTSLVSSNMSSRGSVSVAKKDFLGTDDVRASRMRDAAEVEKGWFFKHFWFPDEKKMDLS